MALDEAQGPKLGTKIEASIALTHGKGRPCQVEYIMGYGGYGTEGVYLGRWA